MTKGTSDRGVRTEESGADEDVPVTDDTAGDEGVDDGARPQTRSERPDGRVGHSAGVDEPLRD